MLQVMVLQSRTQRSIFCWLHSPGRVKWSGINSLFVFSFGGLTRPIRTWHCGSCVIQPDCLFLTLFNMEKTIPVLESRARR